MNCMRFYYGYITSSSYWHEKMYLYCKTLRKMPNLQHNVYIEIITEWLLNIPLLYNSRRGSVQENELRIARAWNCLFWINMHKYLNVKITEFCSYSILLAHGPVFYLLPLGHYDVRMTWWVCVTKHDNTNDNTRAWKRFLAIPYWQNNSLE